MKLNKTTLCRCLAVLLSCHAAGLAALETDPDQPINIDSNTATYDDATATSTYTGNVISVQGSIRVTSDKLVVYFVNGDAEKLVFTGNKAKFKQTPSPGAEDITGESLIGEYYPKQNLLVLINEATVWHGNGTYSSERIEYNSKTSTVKAGDKTSDAKRVHVTLKPKQQSDTTKNDNAGSQKPD
jgi:lipopolysaccharide export system protein LptA